MFDTLRSLAKRGLKNGIAVGGVFDDPLEPDQEPVDVPVNAGENSDSGEQGGSGEQNNSGKKSDSGEKSDPGEMSILSQMSGSTEQDDPPKNTDEKDVPIDGQLEINVVASKWEKDLGKVRGTFGSDDVAIIESTFAFPFVSPLLTTLRHRILTRIHCQFSYWYHHILSSNPSHGPNSPSRT